jgi:hypothetical protein
VFLGSHRISSADILAVCLFVLITSLCQLMNSLSNSCNDNNYLFFEHHYRTNKLRTNLLPPRTPSTIQYKYSPFPPPFRLTPNLYPIRKHHHLLYLSTYSRSQQTNTQFTPYLTKAIQHVYLQLLSEDLRGLRPSSLLELVLGPLRASWNGQVQACPDF